MHKTPALPIQYAADDYVFGDMDVPRLSQLFIDSTDNPGLQAAVAATQDKVREI